MFFGYFERNTLKRNLTDSCFIFPDFHEHLLSPKLPCTACLLKTCFEKINMCNWDNACDVACPDEESLRGSEPTNQAQIKIKLRQFLEHIEMIEKNISPLSKL